MLIYAIFACFLNAPPDVPCQYVNGPYRSAAECQAANVYAADPMPTASVKYSCFKMPTWEPAQ